MTSDALLAFRIWCFALLVPLIARLPVRALQRLIEPARVRSPDTVLASRILHHIDSYCRWARPVINSRCMTRGITLYYFLRRAGIEVELVFGVGTISDQFAGHCWLTQDGKPYLEKVDPLRDFTAVYTVRPKPSRPLATTSAGKIRG